MTSDYATFHQNRQSLWLHLIGVPVFAIAFACAVYAAVLGRYVTAALSMALVVIAFALQGVGHKRERVPPRPFKGPVDFATRVLLEQYYRFWVFLFSGEFLEAYRQGQAARDA
jgi:uncharacterized membrane protein YGL010W